LESAPPFSALAKWYFGERLPFNAPDRIVTLFQSNPSLSLSRFWISPANYLDLRDQNQVFTGLAAYGETDYNLTGAATPVRVAGTDASDNFFETLGAKAMLGRAFTRGEESVCVLSHRLMEKNIRSSV